MAEEPDAVFHEVLYPTMQSSVLQQVMPGISLLPLHRSDSSTDLAVGGCNIHRWRSMANYRAAGKGLGA